MFMKCPHCGNELKDDAKFCDKCGAGFGGNDSTSATVNPANAKKKIYKRWFFGYYRCCYYDCWRCKRCN